MTRKKPAREIVAANVDMLKERRALSAKALSERSGVSPSMLRKLRNGGNISIELVEALAKVLGVQPADLLNPQLETQLDLGEKLPPLAEIYVATSDLGRQTINQALHVAEALVTYRVNREDI